MTPLLSLVFHRLARTHLTHSATLLEEKPGIIIYYTAQQSRITDILTLMTRILII